LGRAAEYRQVGGQHQHQQQPIGSKWQEHTTGQSLSSGSREAGAAINQSGSS